MFCPRMLLTMMVTGDPVACSMADWFCDLRSAVLVGAPNRMQYCLVRGRCVLCISRTVLLCSQVDDAKEEVNHTIVPRTRQAPTTIVNRVRMGHPLASKIMRVLQFPFPRIDKPNLDNFKHSLHHQDAYSQGRPQGDPRVSLPHLVVTVAHSNGGISREISYPDAELHMNSLLSRS